MYTPGLDFSTQSVKALVLDVRSAEVIHTDSFEYDPAFPEYGTEGGVLPSLHPALRHTSPLMLLEALDQVFIRLQNKRVDLSLVGAVKIDAMQHCTVYADASFGERVESLDAVRGLLPQLGPSITRRTSPIWEDRSPVKEAEYVAKELEKCGSMVALTGNRAELRFPASQILKWASESPASVTSGMVAEAGARTIGMAGSPLVALSPVGSCRSAERLLPLPSSRP